MSLWNKYTKDNLCPHCNHFDWVCRYGEKQSICMRVQSDRPSKDGGWYHPIDPQKPKPVYVAPKKQSDLLMEQAAKKMFARYDEFFKQDDWANEELAKTLGVSVKAVESLWICHHQLQFGIPMRDGDNNVIGIHLRHEDGTKRAVTGSRNGLFIPQCEPDKIAYLVEGASNTAAMLTMGYFALGRPSCNTGGEMLKVALKRLGIHRVVIVADADDIKSTGKRPGYEGAVKLKQELGLMSVVICPPKPCKDVRSLLQTVGLDSARHIIKNSIAGKVWSKV